MILTISTTHVPATDLGYILHKNPARLNTIETSAGHAHVFYSEATPERCTAVLYMEIDPIQLVRGRSGSNGESGTLGQYVNDRPYSANSFMSIALREAFSTAMTGRCKEKPELAETALPLEVHFPTLPVRGGERYLRDLFEPLGYEVTATVIPLDERFPEWGKSKYLDVTLRASMKVVDLLTHLYVLIPVLDDSKHYWVDEAEVEKLLRRGEGWLSTHPQKESITSRYLRRQMSLTRLALAQLVEEDEPDLEASETAKAQVEEEVEARLSLHDIRLNTVADALLKSGAHRVVDLGCGEGKLLGRLLRENQFDEIVGMDVAISSLEKASRRLHLDRLPPRVAQRLTLLQGSLVYRDRRLNGYDAAAVVEVIEHLDASRLTAFERVLFEKMQPKTVIITTPNQEYNALFPTLPSGQLRHKDHRFEWTRAEFESWANGIAGRYGYSVEFAPVGPVDETHGAPSQMGVFTLA